MTPTLVRRLRRWELAPLPLSLVVGGAAALLVLGLAASVLSTSLTPFLAAAGMLALAAFAYLGTWFAPGTFVALALAASIFSGNFGAAGVPIPLDRVFLAAGLLSLIVHLPGAERARVIRWRPVHAVLGMAAAYATIRAVGSGSMSGDGLFGLLDRFGIVPMLVFTIAPLLFGTTRTRNVLLGVLVVTGAYLSLVAFAEGLDLGWLVFPRYIVDPSFGIHAGRARGPFAEAVGMGLGLYGCAVAAAVAAYTWRQPRARLVAGVVAGACILGTIFTLTRAVWLATLVATLLAMLASPQTRRYLTPMVLAGVAGLALALLLLPDFATAASERQSDQRPIWDRYNTNVAAINALRDEPLFGIGWEKFNEVSDQYFQLADDYPLTGTDIKIHNVPLSHATELGLVGASLWLLAVALAIGGSVLRPGPAELDPWRLGMIAIGAHWATVGAFGPLGYAFPNLLVWLWAGVCSIGHLSVPVDREARREDARP